MITDEDVLKLSKVFATKHEVEIAKQEILERYDEKSDRILEVLDSFAKEIKDHRTEQVLHQQKHEDIVERLEKIEKVPVISQVLKS